MKQGRTDRDWAVVAAMAFIAGAVLAWALLSKHPPQPRPPTVIDWPSWIQAVGSVAGIFSVAAVAWWEQKNRQQSQDAADQREKVSRYVRANRVLGRFLDRIDQQLADLKALENTNADNPLRKRSLPKELKRIEGELHLIKDGGGPAKTAMDAFVRAQKKINCSQLRFNDRDDYRREMEFARSECAKALNVLFDFLKTLKS